MVSTVEKINPEQESLNQVLGAKTMTEMKQVFASLKEQDESRMVYMPLKQWQNNVICCSIPVRVK